MKIAVTGASGLLASAFLNEAEAAANTVIRLVRRPPKRPDEIWWTPGRPLDGISGFDAVVNLAGARIDRRWTASARREIWDSRVEWTRALSEALAALPRPPSVLLSASAVGFYGDRDAETVDESAGAGRGFLAEVASAWEAATAPAQAAGIRVVHLRFGVVLSPRGGALARMLPLFRLGLGGPLGGGWQMMSWVHIADAARAMRHLLNSPGAAGPYNITAPNPVSNREFAQALGRALGRPAVLPVPAFALRLMFGKMADEALLSGVRALPRRLLESGFTFSFPELPAALASLVGK